MSKKNPPMKFARPLPPLRSGQRPTPEASPVAAPFLLRAVPLEMWREIVARAKRNRRSINSELIVLLESAIDGGLVSLPRPSSE